MLLMSSNKTNSQEGRNKMSNMSYCRFENTLKDLEDCSEALGNGEAEDSELNEYEKKAKEKLIKLCVSIACDYGDCSEN
jgi:hypothetical protein